MDIIYILGIIKDISDIIKNIAEIIFYIIPIKKTLQNGSSTKSKDKK